MNYRTTRQYLLVIDSHIVRVAVDVANQPESTTIEVTVDGHLLRGWEEPGWRDISFGVTSGNLYWWTARRVVEVELCPPSVVAEFSYDEDIVSVFHLAGMEWLVVGETSVSIVRNGSIARRLEFGEAIVSCLLDSDTLIAENAEGETRIVRIESDTLQIRL